MSNDIELGAQYVRGLTDSQRKTAAYNALNAAYGPAVAYDPENAFKASQASVSEQTIPTQVEQSKATLANTQADIPLRQAQTAQAQANTTNLQNMNDVTAGIRGARMLQAIANPDGSIPQDEATHILSNPAYKLDQTQIGALAGRMAQPNGKAVLDDIVTALQAGGKATGATTVVTNPDGTTTLYRGTSTGGLIGNNIGTAQTATQSNAAVNKQLAPYRAVTGRIAATSPKAVVVDANGGVNLVGGGKVTPTNIQSIQGPTGAENKAAKGVVGKAEGTNEANALPQNVNIARADLGQMDLQYQRTNAALDKALTMVGSTTTGPAGAIAEHIPGTQRQALDGILAGIKSNVALLTANMARQGGKSSGIVVRNLREFEAFQDNLGKINLNAAPSAVREQIATAKTNLQALQAGVHARYAATYGPALGNTAPAAPAAAAGWGNFRAAPSGGQ